MAVNFYEVPDEYSSAFSPLVYRLSGIAVGETVEVAVARSEQEVMASPPADFVMEAGDLLYLFGKTDKLFAVKPVICAAPATPAAATAQEASRA